MCYFHLALSLSTPSIIIIFIITLITSSALQRRLSTIRVDALSVIQLGNAFWERAVKISDQVVW